MRYWIWNRRFQNTGGEVAASSPVVAYISPSKASGCDWDGTPEQDRPYSAILSGNYPEFLSKIVEIARKLLNKLALPTGFEPVLPP